jgi:hypothetical protein
MHAMEARIDLSVADKARLVWKAARVPKCGPLDDKAAETLGKALEWAAQWRIIADSTLPPRERERLKSIELAADKLSCLLARYPATRGRIEQCWPDFPATGAPPDLRSTRRGLAALRKTAGLLQAHKGGGRVLREKFGSAEKLFIQQAGDAYFKHTSRKPKIGRHVTGVVQGPFVRFVQEASMQFCKGAASPSPETIKSALRATWVRPSEK